MAFFSLAAAFRYASEPSDDMTEWVKCDSGKGAIDRAGSSLVDWWVSVEAPTDYSAWHAAFAVVENWRACHALPLNVIQRALRGRAQRIEPKVIVAQRLKRFSSIMNKLARESSMKLSQMQDLGGCRAILSNIAAVNSLYDMYRIAPLLPEEGSLKCYDYVSNPKDDGYRGIHVVARYHPRIRSRAPWDGYRIEIQLRTNLQHAFATAVETVTTFTRAPLKFGAGPAEWRRFFSLMGSALATREQTPLVPGTPSDQVELIRELRAAAVTLRVRSRLQGWTDALQTLRSQHLKNSKWLLLLLDTSKNTVGVTGFQDRKEASRAIAEIEKSKRADIDAVLVWVSSIRRLRVAYPNYYADTKKFIDALDSVLA
ncbi:MAG TPA: RelA/SpoT domain-containing protein [Candidatus Acidoferrales bacterium]|nr:RelA/SpoT domain-containing protein [Candidatus Acidoferrales bacterium]